MRLLHLTHVCTTPLTMIYVYIDIVHLDSFAIKYPFFFYWRYNPLWVCTRVGTLIVATIYLQLIQNRYMFRSFTGLQCSHQHCVQPVASDVEVVGYI